MKITSPAFFRFGQFRALDFAIDLRKRFLAAHRQHRVAEADEDGEDTSNMCEVPPYEPSQAFGSA